MHIHITTRKINTEYLMLNKKYERRDKFSLNLSDNKLMLFYLPLNSFEIKATLMFLNNGLVCI